MLSITSPVSFGTTSKAFMFSVTCSAREAPVITVLTFGFFQAPGEGKLCHAAAQVFSDTGQLAHFLDLLFAGFLVFEIFPLTIRNLPSSYPGSFGNAIVVFSGQHSTVKRTPDCCTKSYFLV
jgi:hypothetical protein